MLLGMKDLRKIIGDNLSELRKRRGLTQFELAEKFNYTDRAVSKWENDVSSPDILVLASLADILGVSVDELLARLRALMRRKPKYDEEKKEDYGDLSLNDDTFLLSCGEKSVPLMNKEYQIMSLLMKANGKVVSLDTISKSAWDSDSYSTNENVWVFISYLRKKIEGIGSKVKIKSIRYQGYYLES